MLGKKTGCIVLVAALSACQTQPATYYTPPTAKPPKALATLVGSKELNRNLFYNDEITYIHAIDDLPVKGFSKNYHIPIQVTPGKHSIVLGFAQGNGCAEATFEINLQSRKKYIAKGKKLGRERIFRPQNVTLWMEDSEGNKATKKAIVPFKYCGGGLGGLMIFH